MELVVRDTTTLDIEGVIDPTTGEVLDLHEATREQIAEWYLHVTDWLSHAMTAVRVAERAFCDKTDMSTKLSVVVSGKRVSVPAAESVFQPDVGLLRAVLLEQVHEGKLTIDAVNETVQLNGVACPNCDTWVTTGGHKVSAAALKALRKQPRLNALIDSCGEYVKPTRRFKVASK